MALITAGGLLLRLAGKDKLLKEATVKVEEEYEKDAVKGDPAPKGTPTVKTFKAEAKELFDQARIDGAGLPELEKLIKLAHEQKYVLKLPDYLERGSAIGPQVINRHIAGGATHPFKIPFFAGQPATFGFRYTGPCHVSVVRSDVDHIVANGVIMVGNANWIPRGRPGAAPVYTVRIRNMSPGPVSYQFFTN